MDLDNIMLLKKNIIKIENNDKNSKEVLEIWEKVDLYKKEIFKFV